MILPVVMYGCETWRIKIALYGHKEHQRIDASELWCWRRLLRVPWTARRSNQSVLKHINLQFIKRTAAEAEAPILWLPDTKSWLEPQHLKNEDHGIQSHHFMANRWRNKGNSDRLFSWALKSLQMVTAAIKLKDTCSLEEKLWQI